MPASGRRHSVVGHMSFPSIDHRTSASTATVHGVHATPARLITVVLADDHRVVRSGLRVLLESDGPMLKHGLQEMNGSIISVPRRRDLRPDSDRLEERYAEFRATA